MQCYKPILSRYSSLLSLHLSLCRRVISRSTWNWKMYQIFLILLSCPRNLGFRKRLLEAKVKQSVNLSTRSIANFIPNVNVLNIENTLIRDWCLRSVWYVQQMKYVPRDLRIWMHGFKLWWTVMARTPTVRIKASFLRRGNLSPNMDQVQTTEDPTQGFDTHSEIQALLGAEMERLTLQRPAPVLAEVVEDELMYQLKVDWNAAKLSVSNPLLNLVGEVIVDISKLGKMGSLFKTLRQHHAIWENFRQINVTSNLMPVADHAYDSSRKASYEQY